MRRFYLLLNTAHCLAHRRLLSLARLLPLLRLIDRPEKVVDLDSDLDGFSTPVLSRSATPSLVSTDDEIPAETVSRGHLVILQNIPGQHLLIRQCTGQHVEAVFVLHDDGIYQTNMRATAATHRRRIKCAINTVRSTILGVYGVNVDRLVFTRQSF